MTAEDAIFILECVEAHGIADDAKKRAIEALKAELVKHGRIEDGKCSACGHIIKAWADDYVRCPYCGAKMDKVKE